MKKKLIIFTILSIFLYAYNIEPNKLVLNQQDISVPHWEYSLNGLKVAVVSDLHIGTKRVPLSKVKKVVNLVNSQNPDLIILPGDFDAVSITYSKTSEDEISRTLAEFKAPYGVYAVLGNHDYEPAGVVKPILDKAGIKLLQNDSVKININNKKLRLCGIVDIWQKTGNVNLVLGNINEPTIFISHNPDVFPRVPDKVSLTISGHTHGGEINIPLIGPPHVPSNYGQKYAKGHIIEDNKHLFVTSGVASLSRMRFFNPPEVVILNIKKADS